ncbi:hypothetical protein KDH_68870 [Dictyobacter sp. S3.2.2.5]|uniref:OAA-family lectin sugar binding domain-containing protein n=1 Tax=Dictyobacter halimunensis TaxID=3026934 RepID=A0ABQ6G0P1_9CHLR|nr:hypothetical protein KDH_68870 [Dictyobacter sp. S3.2.2.5]
MKSKRMMRARRDFLMRTGTAGMATLLLSRGGTAFAHPMGDKAAKNGTTYTYATQNSWGAITSWHTAADLSFSVDAGTGSPPANISWRDQQGNSFAISFASDMSSFFGYFQRVNEGPIAYRGTRK